MTEHRKIEILLQALEEAVNGPYYPPNTAALTFKYKYEAHISHARFIRDLTLKEITEPDPIPRSGAI